MNILGISAYYHDSAACLLQDGVLRAAAQEERFTRLKHDAAFPAQAIAYCLREAGLTASDLDLVAFYEKPFRKFERIMETFLAYAPAGLRTFLHAVPLWIKQRLWMKEHISTALGYEGTILFPEHHLAHAAAAFFPSPFQQAAILTVDGVGEWTSTSYGVGQDNQIALQAEMAFPHSLGLLYSAFTGFLGFKVNAGEYKLMGLAPYGNPTHVQTILSELLDLRDDGSFALNMRYFNYGTGLTMVNRRFAALFGMAPRDPESPLTQQHMDLARSIQEVTEEIMLRMARHVQQATGERYLCLAGGVALNCVANGRILREGPFTDIWMQPAAGDAGGAVGAAYSAWHQYLEQPRQADPVHDSMHAAYLGPAFDDDAIIQVLEANGQPYRILDEDTLLDTVTEDIADEKVVGWFQGRMEFGPRALGNRSILGDARSPRMQDTLNLKIKFRESFRPFAPSVAAHAAAEYFTLDRPSPYMLLVAPVSPVQRRTVADDAEGLARLHAVRSTIPAVTHVDHSARVHTVTVEDNPLFHRLLVRFGEKTWCPVLINTSFNVRGEPIVCTPEEAYQCFLHTHMDCLVMGHIYLEKTPATPAVDSAIWMRQFAPD